MAGLAILILGVALWWLAHLFKRLAPGLRARMGPAGRGVVALALILSVVLMVWGYRAADPVMLYAPLPGMGHVNNLLMLFAIYLFGVGGTKGVLYPRLRHPMLWGVIVWAGAHLLVNGDLASLLLFGGLGLWAVVAMAAINRSASWTPPADGRGLKGDAMNAAGTVVLYAAIAWAHTWLGYYPFHGSYG